MANTAFAAGTTSKPTLNPALREFWTKPARNRVLKGGRASSKSWDAAGFCIFLMNRYKLRVLCVRQFQNKIEESVYALLKVQIERFGMASRFDVQKSKIYSQTGSEAMFYGLWRSIDEIKGLENIDILWIEEAHNLTEAQWKILEPTIRKNHSQVWIVFNPKLATDFVYKRFVLNPPPDTIVRHINYDENPFLSPTMMKIIEAAKAEDYDDYAHHYLGVPLEDDDGVVIKRSWLLAAIDAHKALGWEARGRRVLGFDVADSGADKCAEVLAHGSVVTWADMWKAGEDELLKSCTRVFNDAVKHGAGVVYDSIGVGAAAGAKFNELSTERKLRLTHEKFNAGGAIYKPDQFYAGTQTKNGDMFSNIKAQAWWGVADRFRNTYNAVRNGQKFPDDELISLASDCPHLDQLIEELSTPRRDFDKNGRVMVESKKDLAKREVPSPNLADGLIMCFAPRTAPMRIDPNIFGQL